MTDKKQKAAAAVNAAALAASVEIAEVQKEMTTRPETGKGNDKGEKETANKGRTKSEIFGDVEKMFCSAFNPADLKKLQALKDSGLIDETTFSAILETKGIVNLEEEINKGTKEMTFAAFVETLKGNEVLYNEVLSSLGIEETDFIEDRFKTNGVFGFYSTMTPEDYEKTEDKTGIQNIGNNYFRLVTCESNAIGILKSIRYSTTLLDAKQAEAKRKIKAKRSEADKIGEMIANLLFEKNSREEWKQVLTNFAAGF